MKVFSLSYPSVQLKNKYVYKPSPGMWFGFIGVYSGWFGTVLLRCPTPVFGTVLFWC